MALSLKHDFVSPKVDGPDTTVMRPSDWNGEHDITVSGRSLVGKTDTGTGPAVQIDVVASVMSILQAATVAEICTLLGVTPDQTGDGRLTMASAAPTGWIFFDDGTIGNAASGATTRANADTAALYSLIWNTVINTWAPIYTSAGAVSTRGANAAADYAANKRLAVPRTLGRALVAAGTGAGGLSTRALGEYFGAETVTISQANLPNFNLDVSGLTVVPSSTPVTRWPNVTTVDSGSLTTKNVVQDANEITITFDVGGTLPSGGSGTATAIVQPSSSAFRVIVKL